MVLRKTIYVSQKTVSWYCTLLSNLRFLYFESAIIWTEDHRSQDYFTKGRSREAAKEEVSSKDTPVDLFATVDDCTVLSMEYNDLLSMNTRVGIAERLYKVAHVETLEHDDILCRAYNERTSDSASNR